MADFSRYSATEVLKDGRTILLRAIRPDDRTAMVEGLAMLGETSVYTRFHGSVSEISEEDLAFYTEIDYEHHMALVAAVEDEGGERLIAGCRYIEHAGTVPRRAEVAFTVLDAFQGLGIGTLLLRHLTAIARETGIEAFEAEVLPQNTGMMRVFKKSGLRMSERRDGGVVHVTLHL
jgi:RimJ/RimL family protein N-acetyltransferase